MERVLKDVGDFGSTAAAIFLDDRTLGPWEMALIWSDSRGFLGGLDGSDMVVSWSPLRAGVTIWNKQRFLVFSCSSHSLI